MVILSLFNTKEKKIKKVYIGYDIENFEPSLIYPELHSSEHRNKQYDWATWYQCHAALEQFRNLYTVKSPIDVEFKWPVKIGDTTKIFNIDQPFAQTWNNAHTIGLKPKIYLYCEESLFISIEHPFMHDNDINRNGFIVPAKIDISEWYRRTQPSYQFFPRTDRARCIKIKKGDVVSYLRFHTSEKIKFIPYKLNKDLLDLELERGAYMHLERNVKTRPADRLEASQKKIEDLVSQGKTRENWKQRVLEEIKKSIEDNKGYTPFINEKEEDPASCPYSKNLL